MYKHYGTYRFFYHYHKQKKLISIHFRGKCYFAKDLWCGREVESKWNKRQPYLVIQGYARNVSISNNKATIM